VIGGADEFEVLRPRNCYSTVVGWYLALSRLLPEAVAKAAHCAPDTLPLEGHFCDSQTAVLQAILKYRCLPDRLNPLATLGARLPQSHL
jgi:hypothetical protein